MAVIAFWFVIKQSTPETAFFDFIKNFSKSEKNYCYDSGTLSYSMPDNKLIIKRNKSLTEVYKLPYKTIILDRINSYRESDLFMNGVFRLILTDMEETGSYLNFELAPIHSKKQIRFTFMAGHDPRLAIFEIIGSTSTEIASIDLRTETNSKYILNIIFMESQIIVFDPSEILFIWNRDEIDQFKLIPPEGKGEINYSVKFAPLALYIERSITMSLPKLFQKNPGFNYISSRKWNGLFPEHLMTTDSDSQGYVQRIKIGQDVMPAIIIPSGGKIRYKAQIPEGGKLEFYLTLPPRKTSSLEKRLFNVSIFNMDSSPLKVFEINEINAKRTLESFVPIKLDLSNFSSKNVVIEFRYENGGKLKIPDFVCVAAPSLYPSNRYDKPNIILISLDTLRADHLGIYGYKRNTTPNIDKFAGKGTMFVNAISNSPWTLPSHMSFLTSLYPYETGLRPSNTWYSNSRLAPWSKTLAEYLKDSGYKTSAITGGSYLSAIYGYDKGFDIYHEQPHYQDKDAAREVNQAISWIENNRTDKFFLFFHTYEIHEPYLRDYFCKAENIHTNAKDIKPLIIAKYDSGIRYADESIGKLLGELDRLNILQKTAVIITSDHGENFDLLKTNKHGTSGSHGDTLYDVELKVPLIIGGYSDFMTGRKITEQVSLVDILPSILDMIGAEAGDKIRGRSFLPLIDRRKTKESYAYSEGIYRAKYDKKALRTNNFKYIYDTTPFDEEADPMHIKYEYYDVKKDPHEKRNIAQNNRQLIEKLNIQLRKITSSILANYSKLNIRKQVPAADTKELQEQLKKLGYIGN